MASSTDGMALFEQLEALDAAQSRDDYLDADGLWDVEALRQAIEKCPRPPKAVEAQPANPASSEAEPEAKPTEGGSEQKAKPQCEPTTQDKASTKESTATSGAAKKVVSSAAKPPSLKKGNKAVASGSTKGRLLEVPFRSS